MFYEILSTENQFNHMDLAHNKFIAILEMLILTGLAALIGYWIANFFSKKKVNDLSEQIASKELELANCKKSKR